MLPVFAFVHCPLRFCRGPAGAATSGQPALSRQQSRQETAPVMPAASDAPGRPPEASLLSLPFGGFFQGKRQRKKPPTERDKTMNEANKSKNSNKHLVPDAIRVEYLHGYRDGLRSALHKMIRTRVVIPAEQVYEMLQKTETELSELELRRHS